MFLLLISASSLELYVPGGADLLRTLPMLLRADTTEHLMIDCKIFLCSTCD